MIRKDNESFADFITNRFNPDYEYDCKEKEITEHDFRVEKPKTTDINDDMMSSKTLRATSFRHTQLATDLLSTKFDISASNLTDTLKQKYGLDVKDCNGVLKNMSNSKHVSMRVGTFDKIVKLRRR